MTTAVSLKGIKKSFVVPGGRIDVLKGVDLSVDKGGIMAVMGESGAGKSTLLHIIGCIDAPDSGKIEIGGDAVAGGTSARRRFSGRIGLVFQFHNLLPELDALENVALPLRIAGLARRAAEKEARGILSDLGLSGRLGHRPAELSGGEAQRVAIARALAGDREVILADEPTGNLDEATAGAVSDLLFDAVRARGAAMLIATHSATLAEKADEVLLLEGGRLRSRQGKEV